MCNGLIEYRVSMLLGTEMQVFVLCPFCIEVASVHPYSKVMCVFLQCFHVPYSALTMFLSTDQRERDSATAYSKNPQRGMKVVLNWATWHSLFFFFFFSDPRDDDGGAGHAGGRRHPGPDRGQRSHPEALPDSQRVGRPPGQRQRGRGHQEPGALPGLPVTLGEWEEPRSCFQGALVWSFKGRKEFEPPGRWRRRCAGTVFRARLWPAVARQKVEALATFLLLNPHNRSGFRRTERISAGRCLWQPRT